MLNRISLIGNIGNDIELKQLNESTTLAELSVATRKSYKDKSGNWQEVTDWHNCKVWNDKAIKVSEKLGKGDQVYLEGSMTYDKWEDKDGNKRSKAVINVNRIWGVGNGRKIAETPLQTKQPIKDDGLPF